MQIAPIYLASCEKQGLGLLELLFYRQPVQENQMLIKVSLFQLHLYINSSSGLSFTILGSCQKPSPGTYVSPVAEPRDLPSL